MLSRNNKPNKRWSGKNSSALERAVASGSGWLRLRRLANPHVSNEAFASKSSLDGQASQASPNLENISKLRMVEALLMISKEPLSARKIASLAELADPTEARTIARRLNEQYDQLGHAFRIEEVAGGMRFLTRPQFATWLRRLEHVPGEELLSQGMLETLSIVAYRQPLLRAEVEAIRGVSCDEVLRQLMQRDLIRIAGRHEDLGRPYLFGTTRRFLQLFGLQSLDSLPRAQKIRQAEAETATRLAVNQESAQDIPSIANSPIGDSLQSDH